MVDYKKLAERFITEIEEEDPENFAEEYIQRIAVFLKAVREDEFIDFDKCRFGNNDFPCHNIYDCLNCEIYNAILKNQEEG